MNKLYIDDVRMPKLEGFNIVRSYDDAIAYMELYGCPHFISFDHDLGDAHERSGFDIAKWLIERDMNDDGNFIPTDFNFYVHSANPVGAANIEGLLRNYLEVKDR